MNGNGSKQLVMPDEQAETLELSAFMSKTAGGSIGEGVLNDQRAPEDSANRTSGRGSSDPESRNGHLVKE